MTEYYKEKLEQGLEFQDHVTELLMKELGISLSSYSSKKWQLRGENKQGIEIKYDAVHKKTGNFYIEVAEKSAPDNPRYVQSGIYRDDNTWLYIIGDYETLYIFGKSFLCNLHKSGRCQEKQISTSKGFLLTQEQANKYALKIIGGGLE